MSKNLSVRVPDDVFERLENLSKKTFRPKSFYIKEMLASYMAEFEDAYLALERMNDPDTKYYSSEEAKNRLGI
ncbi:type II toxin-antitoxin system RelB family antitoxin [Candidatus Magnetominusculus dajiuhuensis]|uniref:type II toxin-antitoxin system RelB family antitoxin n=1 Tax=Candidatus Magnetominusculus dajiuhuensis TaxID=3137712 RepID=UPI003B431B0F